MRLPTASPKRFAYKADSAPEASPKRTLLGMSLSAFWMAKHRAEKGTLLSDGVDVLKKGRFGRKADAKKMSGVKRPRTDT
jgi:hypothetical protein